jgi:predicted O-methyltransferase YrrM
MSLIGRVGSGILQHIAARLLGASTDDVTAIAKHRPVLTRIPDVAAASERRLAPLYQRYVKQVSSPEFAASFETACLLHAMCTLLRPARMLDLGSGFSSVVLRLHAQEAGEGAVCTVDDDPVWLARTLEFLQAVELPGGDFLLWSEFRKSPGTFDFIFHDLGDMELRGRSLQSILGRVSGNGVVVLDDMHMKAYRPVAEAAVRAAGMRLVSVRRLTLDELGRYAHLALRDPSPAVSE